MAFQEEPPAPVPEWIVTYGDMMSLLLTFFIMLVSLSEIQAESKYRAVLESINARLGYRSAPLAPPGKNFPLDSLLEKLKQLGSHSNTDKGRGGVRARGAEGTEFRVNRRRDGTSLTLGGPVAFSAGSAYLPEDALPVLKRVIEVLAGKPHKIEVRGHVSRLPLPEDSKFSDKYALAYARARKVVDYFVEQGIAAPRVRAGAAADSQPVAADDSMLDTQNDRVEILVLDVTTQEFEGERDIRE